MNEKCLYDKLIEYGSSGNYAFHMPGHKRNGTLLNGMDPFQVDITEIDGFDNLHHAQGIIKEAMDNASDYFGTDKTWFLVNGSSCGILAAISAVTDIGDTIVIGRNCHKAVYNAVLLRDLQVEYLYPEYIRAFGMNGGYNPKELEKIFAKNKKIKAVVLTSPTYDGIVSDIERIAEITHENGAILIVDEAHGAHFGISDKLPKAAYQMGADLVIESIHKTLPSLTQTALLHYKDQSLKNAEKSGNAVLPEKVEMYLGIYETSSPSYLFMASIDRCIRQLQTNGKVQMEKLLLNVDKFRGIVNNLKFIHIPGRELIGNHQVFDVDVTKLVIYVTPEVCNGKQLSDILRKQYHFEMEMESGKYVLGIATICDEEKEIFRLAESLAEIDKQFQKENQIKSMICKKEVEKENIHGQQRLENEPNKNKTILCMADYDFSLQKHKKSCSIYEAKKAPVHVVPLKESAGKVSGEFLYLYPPGIPLLVPGEIISPELLDQICYFAETKMNINGLTDKENKWIQVLKTDS